MSARDPAARGAPSAAPFGLVLVRVEGVEKRFGATVALNGVSFDVLAGETLGLLGANGAGKSTLIKILSGLEAPTRGTILIGGEPRSLADPVAARRCGIVTVHQNIDDGVVFGMSVAENLVLDHLQDGAPAFLTRRAIRRRARAMLDELDMDMPLDAPVEHLSASERQEISIVRALVRKPKLLILDEPTSTLSGREADRLFRSVAAMRRRGVSVLYVSHRMSEIEALCDRVVVLRNGRVASSHTAPLDAKAVTESILGDAILSTTRASRLGGAVVLAARGLRARAEAHPFDLDVRRGEILGITGLVGAGKTELLEQVFGARPIVDGGQMTLDGRPYRPRDQADALARGVAMVPEERAASSIFPGDSLTQHCSIGALGAFSKAGLMLRRRESDFASEVIRDFAVKCRDGRAPIESLSGGNQQKLLVGRWLARPFSLFVLDEPFRGIDIGARHLIGQALRLLSERSAVIVVSSDPEEVIELADRIVVLVDGSIALDARSDAMSAEQLSTVMSATAQAEQSGEM